MTLREEQIHFHESFALAVTQWTMVEAELFRVFHNLLRAPNQDSASAVFHSALNFRTKLDMVDATARIALDKHPKQIDRWSKLFNILEKKSKIRNRVVHSMKVNTAGKAGRRICLRPSIFDVTSYRRKPATYYGSDLERIARGFGQLNQKLHDFANGLAWLLSSTEKSPE